MQMQSLSINKKYYKEVIYFSGYKILNIYATAILS